MRVVRELDQSVQRAHRGDAAFPESADLVIPLLRVDLEFSQN